MTLIRLVTVTLILAGLVAVSAAFGDPSNEPSGAPAPGVSASSPVPSPLPAPIHPKPKLDKTRVIRLRPPRHRGKTTGPVLQTSPSAPPAADVTAPVQDKK